MSHFSTPLASYELQYLLERIGGTVTLFCCSAVESATRTTNNCNPWYQKIGATLQKSPLPSSYPHHFPQSSPPQQYQSLTIFLKSLNDHPIHHHHKTHNINTNQKSQHKRQQSEQTRHPVKLAPPSMTDVFKDIL